MAQLKSTSITGNLSVTGSVLASKIIKLGGTANEILCADGSTTTLSSLGAGTVTSVTVTGNSGLTGTGTITSSGTITLSHADTSSVSNLTAADRTYVKSLTFDTYGHVTGYTTGTETVTNSNTTYTFADGTNCFTVTPSGGSTQTVNVTPSIENNITGSGTANYIPKFTAANIIGNSVITQSANNDITVAGKLIVQSNGSTSGNSYNEGIRVLPASNGWSELFFSNTQTTSSTHANGWILGKRGAAGAISGAAGDFTIECNGSSGTGLTLYANGNKPRWNNNELAYLSDIDVSGCVAKVTSTDNALVRFNGTEGAVQNSRAILDDTGNLKINNSDGGDIALELARGANADWRFLGSGGNLYLQSNFTSSKGSYYNVISLAYNSGAATFKGNVTTSGLILATSGGTAKAALQYNSSDDCIELVWR